MRDAEFRGHLRARLGARSVDSYSAYCRRVERELGIDLDTADLSAAGISNLERELRSRAMAERSIGNCISAVRSYATLLRGEPGGSQRQTMLINPEQRQAWLERTASEPFNEWLNSQVRDEVGRLDLRKLHAVARRFGVDKEGQYAHLNPGQQRMNIGNALRPLVPTSEVNQPPQAINPDDGAAAAEAMTSTPLLQPEESSSTSIQQRPVRELLALYGEILNELRRRKVVRTGNSPVGDYAELLFARAFGWSLEANSASGHDAVDPAGVRYQIKGRRLGHPNASRQLSAIRRLDQGTFDNLAAVLFEPSFKVLRAVIVPHEVVAARARRVEHTNSWTFILDDKVWLAAGARDVTAEVAVAASQI